MNRIQRNMRSNLDRAIGYVDAAEQRAVSDLRQAGFNFESISAARRYRVQLAAVDRANHEHAVIEADVSIKTRARRSA